MLQSAEEPCKVELALTNGAKQYGGREWIREDA